MGKIVSFVSDRLENLVSRMGTSRDKAAHSHYVGPSLTDTEIAAAYDGAWLPRKIVDIPAFDSCRKWRDWQATKDQVEPIEEQEKQLGVQRLVKEAMVKARLWGGSAILIGTGDADLMEPLNPERVSRGGLRYLRLYTRHQLSHSELDLDPGSEWYGLPRHFTLTGQDGGSIDAHPSRFALFRGNVSAMQDISGNQFRWGDSVLVAIMDAIRHADSTAGNIASLIFEAKIDVIRVPNFMQSLADSGYESQWLQRFALAATAKGINGTLILDKEEEYETKSASFSTLPDILDRFLQIVAGAADIPATRLLGQSPAGLNSTGIADLKNYHDRLQASQELDMRPALALLDECLIRSALGSRDASIFYTWAPLEQMSEKESADILKLKADAARAIAGNGQNDPLIPLEALSDALVNSLIEDGSMPGLEQAIERYGSLAENADDPDDVRAAVTPQEQAEADE